MRQHNCRDRQCEAPHDDFPERAAAKEHVLREFEKHWSNIDKLPLCPHGFRRAPGTSWDCSQCLKSEVR